MCLQMSEGVKPTLAELEKFEEQTEGMDIERILWKLVFGLDQVHCSIWYSNGTWIQSDDFQTLHGSVNRRK